MPTAAAQSPGSVSIFCHIVHASGFDIEDHGTKNSFPETRYWSVFQGKKSRCL